MRWFGITAISALLCLSAPAKADVAIAISKSQQQMIVTVDGAPKNVKEGVAKAQAYNITMYVMAVLLVVGFLCNFFITAVNDRHHMKLGEAEARA